jgi:hypothetical protein
VLDLTTLLEEEMLKVNLAIALALVSSSVGALGQAVAPETQVVAMETAYRTAVLSNDIGFFSMHISSRYLGTQANGEPLDASALLEARKHNVYKVKTYDVVNQTVRVTGETGVVSECLALDYTDHGQQKKGNFQVLRVWQKSDSDWKVLAYQITMRANPCQATR